MVPQQEQIAHMDMQKKRGPIDRNQGLRTRVFKARVLEYLQVHLLPHSSKKIVFKIKSNSPVQLEIGIRTPQQ
jgi:hypothetical protein